ncbi:hypothetical protein V1478_009161 [Vespula squamosa]|uniref:Uncharacterized protein n=1 Tax=Vespula squamosa TaxID=30214 RepID=A0ABD2ANU9_VESSQ
MSNSRHQLTALHPIVCAFVIFCVSQVSALLVSIEIEPSELPQAKIKPNSCGAQATELTEESCPNCHLNMLLTSNHNNPFQHHGSYLHVPKVMLFPRLSLRGSMCANTLRTLPINEVTPIYGKEINASDTTDVFDGYMSGTFAEMKRIMTLNAMIDLYNIKNKKHCDIYKIIWCIS